MCEHSPPIPIDPAAGAIRAIVTQLAFVLNGQKLLDSKKDVRHAISSFEDQNINIMNCVLALMQALADKTSVSSDKPAALLVDVFERCQCQEASLQQLRLALRQFSLTEDLLKEILKASEGYFSIA